MIRRLLCALILTWMAGAAFGQEAAPEGFRIETVTVEGGRRPATQGIVIEESRLVAGRDWTERELREAIYRIRRLPFIVRADFALRRGSARGLYALVVTVEETRPFFFSRDFEVISVAQVPSSFALGYGDGHVDVRNAATAGARLFLGSRAVVFASADISAGLQAGFTRYGLFGRGGSATVSVSRHFFCCQTEVVPLGLDPGFVTWSVEGGDSAALSVLLPLSGNHSLRAAASVSRRDAGERRGVLEDPFNNEQFFAAQSQRESGQAEVKWFYDTADDPLFPTQGTTLSGGVELARQSVPVRIPGSGFDQPRIESDSRLAALAATGRKSWPLSPRQAVSFGGRLAVGRSRIDNLLMDGRILRGPVDLDSLESSVEGRYSASLLGFEKTRDFGDLRFEVGSRYGYETTSPSFGGPVKQLALSSSIVFRNSWGVFRVGLTYLDFQRSRR